MKTLLKTAGMALTLAVAAAPQVVSAQAAPALTVDIQRLFSDSAAGKSGASQIQAKYQATNNAAVTAYNAAVATLNTQTEAARKVVKPDGTLPPANQKSYTDASRAAEAAGQKLQSMQDEVNAVERYVQTQILRGAEPVIEQVRGERKAAIVVPKGSALASDPAGDVTPTVIQRLDQSLKTVSIVLPQQPAAGAQAGQPQGR